MQSKPCVNWGRGWLVLPVGQRPLVGAGGYNRCSSRSTRGNHVRLVGIVLNQYPSGAGGNLVPKNMVAPCQGWFTRCRKQKNRLLIE